MPAFASRKLAGVEYSMRLTEAVTPFNVVSVLRLEGDAPGPPQVRAALDSLQRRHPLLQARIVPARKEYFFHFDVNTPIPLEPCAPSPAQDWIAIAQEELHRAFDLAAGPLARCRYLPRESGVDLILTIHHTIVDAASAPQLLKELLSHCAGDAIVEAGDNSQEGQRPASALYPEQYTGVRFAGAAAAFMARQMGDEIAFRWRSRGARKPPIAATGRCCILPVRFPSALTSALIQASRRHAVTLNAIFSAGLLSAVQRHLYPSARVPLRHIIFADLRHRLRATVPETMLGCFLTMLRFTVRVERDGSFWALARDVQESTRRAARSGARYVSESMSPGMMKMILGLRVFRMGATALSYSGPASLPVAYGSFELIGLHAFATNITLGPEYSALVRLFRGEFWWDILYLDSDMDAASAQEIAREVQAVLEQATC
jgi:hypothetical protein